MKMHRGNLAEWQVLYEGRSSGSRGDSAISELRQQLEARYSDYRDLLSVLSIAAIDIFGSITCLPIFTSPPIRLH